MSVKLAKLLKDARTKAGLTQAELAKNIAGLTASDVSKCERNEKEPTVDQLKAIAKLCGVTQKSLIEAASKATTQAAAKKPAAGTTAGKKPAAGTTAGKKPAAGTTAAGKKPAATAAKPPANANKTMKLTTTEKRIIELYRKADTNTKKQVLNLLKGESSDAGDLLQSLLGSAFSNFLKNDTKGIPLGDGDLPEASEDEMVEVEIADPEEEEVSL